MIAFSLSLVIFLVWLATGWAMLSVLWPGRMEIRTLLLAPGLGLGLVIPLIFLLQRAGLAVGSIGPVVTLVLLAASLCVLVVVRPPFPWRPYLPFAGLLVLSLLVTGRPMLEFGLNWVSFANDDMANYVLFAERNLRHGLYDVPDIAEMVSGQDYSLGYWFLDVAVPRPGAALSLAWLQSVSGLPASAAFMPLILAAHVALISVCTGLAYVNERARAPALAACGLLAFSALTTLGTLYQLLPQVIGITSLAGVVTLLMQPFPSPQRGDGVRRGLIIGIFAITIVVTYPEVLPFLVAATAVFILVRVLRQRLSLQPILASGVVGTMLVLGATNTFLIPVSRYLFDQLTYGQQPVNPQQSLFPYFLLPSGLAGLWGFEPLSGALVGDPWLSVGIVLGALLLAVLAFASAQLTLRGVPVATVALIMLLLGVRLFSVRSDFGLFKLAMFLQPFAIGTLVLWWWSEHRPLIVRVPPLLLVGALGAYGQNVYVEVSRGFSSSFVELPGASASGLYGQLAELARTNVSTPLVLDTSNKVLAKLQAEYTRSVAATFPSEDFFWGITNIPDRPYVDLFGPGLHQHIRDRRQALVDRSVKAAFPLMDPDNPAAVNPFAINTIGEPSTAANACGTLVMSTWSQSVINRRRDPLRGPGGLLVTPCDGVNDHLILVSSERGQNQYESTGKDAAFFGLEPDPLFDGGTMSGAGRHMLLQVVNPSEGVRLALEVTASLQANGQNLLPPAVGIGDQRSRFPLVGRGSARVFSPLLQPRVIENRAFVAVDMGVEGQQFADARDGLMRLYGADVARDRRYLVAFVRDVSAVPEEEYQDLAAPSKVGSFPGDLRDQDLEYSGIYEDGWVSEMSFFMLAQPEGPSRVAVRGVVPMIDDPAFQCELSVLLDGRELTHQKLLPGRFDVEAPVSADKASRRRVELRFSGVQQLPPPDGRPAAARLDFVGFD